MTRPLRHVILVEDDPDIALLVTLALGEIGGIEVRHYATPRALLEDGEAAVPDLYLLDYRIGAMTGEDLLERLRADPSTAGVPAIFMTASLMPDRVRRLRNSGALAVIAKPFDPLTLAEQLRAVLANA